MQSLCCNMWSQRRGSVARTEAEGSAMAPKPALLSNKGSTMPPVPHPLCPCHVSAGLEEATMGMELPRTVAVSYTGRQDQESFPCYLPGLLGLKPSWGSLGVPISQTSGTSWATLHHKRGPLNLPWPYSG